VYVPKHFEITDLEEIAQFASRARSADLVTINPDGFPESTLMPCTWERANNLDSDYGSLLMHMARANLQWKSIVAGAPGLAIVRGPEAYISPSNYEGKTTDHKVVPTWNYQSVHLRGTVEVSEDVELLRKIFTNLTDIHESDRDNPWHVSEADPRYFEAQLRGIIAVVLRIEKIEAKYKLSQNRSIADRERVISDLHMSEKVGENSIAEEMKRTLHSEA
jgi:transcriptional regulator